MSGAAVPVIFGPGSLESIRLERRVVGARLFPDSKHLDARVRGTYRVYCGAGNDHTTTIRGPWLTVRLDTTNDFTDADALAHELVEFELEDWSDPCEP